MPEYVGPGNAFTIHLPDDWTYDRGSPQQGELDHVSFHKTVGGIGALRLTAWSLSDRPGTAEKFLARTQKLYAKPLQDESKIYDWIPVKNGFIRASQGVEDGVPAWITLYVVVGRRCAIIASYVVPLLRPKSPEDRVESEAVTKMVLSVTLT
jgi:hypothetical protein